jgi:hypothetical protein
MGYNSAAPSNDFYYFDFSNGNCDTVRYYREMGFFITHASVCDSLGNLLFYTNGQYIANSNNDTLLNSSNFNPGYYTLSYYPDGLGFTQAAIFLTFSANSNIFYVVSESAEYFINKDSVSDAQPFRLATSTIDKTIDNGLGGIISNKKNITTINDTLILGRITATKHANGRDWWVITHKYYSDLYYKLLYMPDTILGPYTQQIGSHFPAKHNSNSDFDISGAACFSPDGTKYAQISTNGTVEVLDFDRCTGIFSNATTISIPLSGLGYGCSFSPNSRYLYANTSTVAYQYDTYSGNIGNSEIQIAVYDSFMDPFDTWFFINQLGPDGKIYISTVNGSYHLHVIENPDIGGIGCSFNPHSFSIPINSAGGFSLPNLPNYRLGRLIGSSCDTLTSTANFNKTILVVSLSPNPNNGNFIINYNLPQNKSGTLQIINVLGKQVYKQTLPQWSNMQRINLPALTNGIYILKINCENNNAVVKFVKEN